MRPTGAIWAAFLLLSASAARAAEGKEGMPQLDFNNPATTSHVVWLGLIFVGFYFALSNWGLPKVAEVLHLRASTIEQDLDAARAAKAQADAAVLELTGAVKSARATAQAEIADALAKAKADSAAQAAVLAARLEAQIGEAEQRIGAARAAALGALKQVATDTATVMVARLAGTAPDAGAIDAAVGSALAARSGAAG